MNQDERRELADEAKDLLESKAFMTAVLELRKRWFGELMKLELIGSVGDLTGMARCASMVARLQALEAIPLELGVLINNHKYGPKK